MELPWKGSVGVTSPRVRIPPSPPLYHVNQAPMVCCLKSPTKNPTSNKRCVLAKYLSPQSGSRLLRSITYTAKQFSNVFASGSFRWSQTLLRHLDTHLIHHTADLFLTHACTILNCIICPPVCRGGLKPYGPHALADR